jgi:hypothetical protein
LDIFSVYTSPAVYLLRLPDKDFARAFQGSHEHKSTQCTFTFDRSLTIFAGKVSGLKMADRRSDSSYDGKVEEAKVAMKMDAKTLNQLSSSGKAAQQNRGKKSIQNLQAAVEDFKRKEQSGGEGSRREGQ